MSLTQAKFLTQAQFTEALNALFDGSADWNEPNQLAESSAAYWNLAMHFIHRHAPWLVGHVVLDPVRMGLMLRRFYRDAYGVGQFHDFLEKKLQEEKLGKDLKKEILARLRGLSVRINSKSPKKPRIAAAFALWTSTLRPLCLNDLPQSDDERVWRLEATINFWITTRYLQKFGKVQIGIADDIDDFDERIRRIWYDLTFRDLNLSSLELMYSSIFLPNHF